MIKKALRINILNEKTIWVPYTENTTISDIKGLVDPEKLELESQSEVKKMTTLLFNGVAMNDTEKVEKRIQPGDILDLQFKLASSLPAEYVTHDKQRSLDMMFALYSAKISKDNSLLKKVKDELSALGKSNYGYSDVVKLFDEI